MVKSIVAFILVSLSAVFSVGQTEQCPRISVEALGGLGEVGQPVPYTVLIQPSENLAALSYLWSVTTARGELGMVKGQGTRTIEVPWNNDAVTVSVRVIGLPERCPDTASASYEYDPPPLAEKLDSFVGSLSKVSPARFIKVTKTALRHPQAELFILISGKRGNVARSISSKRKTLITQLKLHRYHINTIFFDGSRDDDRVSVWLVPPGAELPSP